MNRSLTPRLLAFARELQRAATFRELLEITRTEAVEALGYAHVWLFVADDEACEEVRLIDFAGAQRDEVWDLCPVLRVAGDALLEEIVASDVPVVVEDARTDPRTDKSKVGPLGNRTIVSIPLRPLDKPFGVLGTGTFGDEGVRLPTPEQLDHLIAMGSQLSVAAGRIRLLEDRARAARERTELDRRLLQLQKLESLGMLASGIAHDFNNLLTIVLAGAEVADLHTVDPKVKAHLEAVMGAAERGRELTRQLLAMSRSQALDLQPLDLGGRLTGLLAMLGPVMPASIEVSLKDAEPLPRVLGDPSQLDQVFMNLCINARDAMPSGGRLTLEAAVVELESRDLRAHPWARPGRYLRVTVADTGVGMSDDVLERAFEPFFTTKGEGVGTGLGLAVALGIVRQHGGVLTCDSEVGVGTTFAIHLPVRTEGGAADASMTHRPLYQ